MIMDTTSIYTVLITIITVFGSASAWRYYEKRLLMKEKTKTNMKDDCNDRIAKLEVLLEKSSEDKEKMRSEILSLTSQVSELKVKVEFLEKENRELMAPHNKPKRPYNRKPKK